MADDDSVKTCKVVLLGESGVGKTCIIARFINNTFEDNIMSTTGASYAGKTLTFDEYQGKSIKFEIWDTAGQEKYRSLNNIFIKDSRICIFVYDVSNPKSLEGLSYWVKSAKEILENKAIYGLVGNKIDLEQKINQEEGEKYAKDIDAFFLQCSAKNDKGNFEEFIIKLVNEFLRRSKLEGWEIYAKEDSVNVSAASFTKENKKKCC